MGLLTKTLEENGRQAPESRLDENSKPNFVYFFFLIIDYYGQQVFQVYFQRMLLVFILIKNS
jgi:hypothetical protein